MNAIPAARGRPVSSRIGVATPPARNAATDTRLGVTPGMPAAHRAQGSVTRRYHWSSFVPASCVLVSSPPR